MGKSGVYYIKNKKTGELYVGASIDIERRIKAQFEKLRNKKSKNSRMQQSYNIHGKDNFEHGVLEVCSKNVMQREKFYMEKLKPSFNINSGGGTPGKKMPLPQYKKMIAALSGRVFSKEHCEKISVARKEQEKSKRERR